MDSLKAEKIIKPVNGYGMLFLFIALTAAAIVAYCSGSISRRGCLVHRNGDFCGQGVIGDPTEYREGYVVVWGI